MNMQKQSSPDSGDLRRHQQKVASAELRVLTRRSLLAEAIIASLALLAGAAYAGFALLYHSPVSEVIFAILLCCATVALFVGLAMTRRYFFVRGRQFYAIADRSARYGAGPLEHLLLSQKIFSLPHRIASGVVYGGAVGAAPFVLPGQYPNEVERWALSAFLFFANFLTGFSLYSLGQFFAGAQTLFRKLVVNMWSPDNDSTRIFLGLAMRLSIVTILYVSLSMTSILFSSFQLGPIVVLYIGFSVSIIFLVIVLPYRMVLDRLLIQKRELIRNVGRSMQECTGNLLNNPHDERGEATIVRARHMMEIKKWAEETSYFPLRMNSVLAFGSVLTISIVPVVVDWALAHFGIGSK